MIMEREWILLWAVAILLTFQSSQAHACAGITSDMADKIAESIAARVARMEASLDSPRPRPSILVRSSYALPDSEGAQACNNSVDRSIRAALARTTQAVATLADTTSALLREQVDESLKAGVSLIDPQSANAEPQYFDTNYIALVYVNDQTKAERCATNLYEIAKIDIVSSMTKEVASVDNVVNRALSAYDVFSSSKVELRDGSSPGVFLAPPSGRQICPRESLITISSVQRQPLLSWRINLGCFTSSKILQIPEAFDVHGGSRLTFRGYVTVTPVDKSRHCKFAESEIISIRSSYFPRALSEGWMPHTPLSQCMCGIGPIGATAPAVQCAYGYSILQACPANCYPQQFGAQAVCATP